MKAKNFWDTDLINDYVYFSSLEDFFCFLNKEICCCDLYVRDRYTPNEEPVFRFEQFAKEANCTINYTDSEHCFLVSKSYNRVIISNSMFEKYKDELKRFFYTRTMELIENGENLIIYGFFFSDNLLDKALNSECMIDLCDVQLTDEQIKKIQNTFLYVRLNGEQLSDKFCGLTKNQLRNEKKVFISSDESFDRVKNALSIVRNNCIFKFRGDEDYDFIFEVLEEAKKQRKKFKYIFCISQRNDFYNYIGKLSEFVDEDIIIHLDLEEYTVKDFLQENQELENLVSEIKKSNLSSFEKYVAVYNIVKKFKPYLETTTNNLFESRILKYILKNNYIVCGGYSNLLIDLLNRVGIEASYYSTDVSKVNDSNELEELGGHVRVIVNMQDEKYGIDGYFIADPTWDNHGNKLDTYDYLLCPFNGMQRESKLFSLQELDYILDNCDFNSFCLKKNQLFNIAMREKKDKHESYEYIFNMIIDLFKKIDKKKYVELRKYIDVSEDDRDEDFYERFLTDVGHYIVSKSNHEISPEVIGRAVSVAKFYNEDVPDVFRIAYKDKVINDFSEYFYEFTSTDPFDQGLKKK